MATLGLLLLFAFASISMALNPIVLSGVDTKTVDICEQCQDAVAKLRKILEYPETEKRVLDTIEHLCNLLLVPSVKQKCKDTANKYFRELQEKMENPDKLCRDLKACRGQSSDNMALNPIVPFEIDTNAADACEQCQDAIGKLKKVLEDPETEKKVLDTVHKFCSFLITPALKQKCEDVATKAFRDAQEALKDPAKVCRDLRACK
jgi:triphosphoribosyl-dephospho-CoA synthetase